MKQVFALLLCIFLFGISACDQGGGAEEQQETEAEIMPHQDEGGALINAVKLREVFNENADEKVIGIAFAGKKNANKRMPTIELTLLKVYHDGNNFMADTIAGDYFDGGIMFGNSNGKKYDPKELEFEFSSMVSKSKKFDFGFMTKDQYDLLMQRGAKQFLVTGAKVDFGNIEGIVGEYFTFKVEAFPKNVNVLPSSGIPIAVPDFQLTLPCPPDWFLAQLGPNQSDFVAFWDELVKVVNQTMMN